MDKLHDKDKAVGVVKAQLKANKHALGVVTGSWDEMSVVSSGANTRILSVAGHLEESKGHLPHRPMSAKHLINTDQGGGAVAGAGAGAMTEQSQKRHSSTDSPLPPPPPPLTGSAAVFALLTKKPPLAMAHLLTQKETKKWAQLELEASRLVALEEEHTVQVTPLSQERIYYPVSRGSFSLTKILPIMSISQLDSIIVTQPP